MIKTLLTEKGEKMNITKELRFSLKDADIVGEVGDPHNPMISLRLFTEEDLEVFQAFLEGEKDRHIKFETSLKGGEIEISLVNNADGKYLFTIDLILLPMFLAFKDKLSKK